jgi:hypothetical protein
MDTSELLPYLILSELVPRIVVSESTGCWFTSRKVNRNCYQRISCNYSRAAAHVLSAKLFLNYKADSKLLICHKCDTPACFNPNHLFIGTAEDNMLDAIRKGRTRAIWKNNLLNSNIDITDINGNDYIDEDSLPDDFSDLI